MSKYPKGAVMKVDFSKKFEQLGSEMDMLGVSPKEMGKEEFPQLEGTGTQKHPAKPPQPTAMKFLD